MTTESRYSVVTWWPIDTTLVVRAPCLRQFYPVFMALWAMWAER